MSSKENNTDNREQPKEVVRFKWEYKQFLEFAQKRQISRAIIYAKTLGISRQTMSHWISQPEMREALTIAVDEVIDGMKTAGHKDWRMWQELYKMLGLDDVKNLDITSDGEKLANPMQGLTTEELRKLAK